MEEKGIVLRIKGKVQGVYFRASTQEKANSLGVKGFVKNLPNGEVYVEAEGNPDKIAELEAWCSKGPDMAKVSNVEKEEANIKGYKSFKVL